MNELIQDHIVYKLKKPFEYHSGGNKVTAKSVIMNGPAFKNRLDCDTIIHVFLKMVKERQELPPDKKLESLKKKIDKKDDEITGSNIVAMFLSLADHQSCFESFNHIMTSGIFSVDGKEELTDIILEKISLDDYHGLFGEYIRFFLLKDYLN